MGRRWFARAVRAVVVIAVPALAAGSIVTFVAVRSGRLHVQPVLTGSMHPAIDAGDLVVTRPVETASLRVGDVIVFYPPGETQTPRVHRITSITGAGDGGVIVTTRGDANGADDPWQAHLVGDTAYRVVAVVPVVGFVATWLDGPVRPALLIGLGGVLGLLAVHESRAGARGVPVPTRGGPTALATVGINRGGKAGPPCKPSTGGSSSRRRSAHSRSASSERGSRRRSPIGRPRPRV
jgi:signal peptidase I